jgi:hypothetical protein
MQLFRAGHPPLFIPWSAIQNPRQRKWRWFDTIAFDVGIPPVATVRLPSWMVEEELRRRGHLKAVPY